MKSLLKLLFTISLFSISQFILHGQRIAVERIQESYLKINQSNYLQIVVENKNCDSLIIISSAKIEKAIGDCTWVVTPTEYPEERYGLKIEICELSNSDTIHLDYRYYHLEKLDPLHTSVGFHDNGDSLTVNEMMNQEGIHGFQQYGKYGCVTTLPKYFKCLILRNFKLISLLENYGGRFNSDIIKSFSLLQKGDEVYFLDIQYGLEKRYEGILQTVKLIIK